MIAADPMRAKVQQCANSSLQHNKSEAEAGDRSMLLNEDIVRMCKLVSGHAAAGLWTQVS